MGHFGFQFIIVLTVIVMAGSVYGAFIVEAHSSGLANENFASPYSEPRASIPSGALGLTATNSIFGGNELVPDKPDTYIYSYTPGVNVDNVFIASGTDLGNGDLASGLTGGESGLYNVYITWPGSSGTNPAGSLIEITNDGDTVVLNPVGQNLGQTGDPGGSDAWLLIAEGISLTEGVTYKVTQVANVDSWVSQRSHGVMWEEVPEPGTMLLFGAGTLLLRRKR